MGIRNDSMRKKAPKKSKFTGMENHQVFAAKVEEEMVKTGGKLDDFKARFAAGQRLLKADPKLAAAYHRDPYGAYEDPALEDDDDQEGK